MKYIHIFTDGIDKLLSLSIWGKHYGGNKSFFYYAKNEGLKGYVSTVEYKRLANEGKRLFNNTVFISNLENVTNQLAEKVKQKNITSDIDQAAQLLEECYRNYFYTEEYYTDQLHPKEDTFLIKKIGNFRLNFINTCIHATEHVYNLAEKKYGKELAQFMMIEEVKSGKVANNIQDRKNRFLVIKENIKLNLYVGQNAERLYLEKIQLPKRLQTKIITGKPASTGKITGKVFLISLTAANLEERIDAMPHKAILVTESTQPALLLACQKAAGIITNEGGVLSHAAIISRENKIPCIVGTRNATQILRDGAWVELDGEQGTAKLVRAND